MYQLKQYTFSLYVFILHQDKKNSILSNNEKSGKCVFAHYTGVWCYRGR